MIRISVTSPKRSFIWLPLIVSLGLHVGFLWVGEYVPAAAPPPPGPSRVTLIAPPPPPDAPPEIKPVEAPPKPKPKPKLPTRPPRANRQTPPPKADTPPPPPVFGVTKESVAEGTGTVAVRVGNTLEKTMETKPTPVEAVAPLPATKAKGQPAPVPLYELSRTPSFKYKVEPLYPPELRREGEEGFVELRVLIGVDGRVKRIKVLKASHRQLARAAVKAAKQSRFVPGYKGDTPVPVQIVIPYRFLLDA